MHTQKNKQTNKQTKNTIIKFYDYINYYIQYLSGIKLYFMKKLTETI